MSLEAPDFKPNIEYWISSREKIKDYPSTAQLIKLLKAQGKSVIYVDGVFDVIHLGHLEYCELAKTQGDVLVVGIKTDSMVRKNKGVERPIHTQEERQMLLAGFGAVNYVTILPEMESLTSSEWRIKILQELLPTAYAIMRDDAQLDEKRSCVDAVPGVGLLLLDGTLKTRSTTSILDKIRGGEIGRG